MKIVYGVFLLAALIALTQAFPGVSRYFGDSSEIDDDSSKKDGVVVIIPPRRNIFDEFEAVDDDDESSMPSLWNPFRINTSSFEDMFTKMRETMKQIRKEMAEALASRLGQGGLMPWGKIPEGANTTSTTKIIGDHSVTINETTYQDGNEESGTIFRVRVVDIKPLNDTTTTINVDNSSAGNNESSIEEKQPSTIKPTENVPTTTNDDKNNREELTTPATRSVESDDKNNREELTTPATRSVETVEELDNEINNNKNQYETFSA